MGTDPRLACAVLRSGASRGAFAAVCSSSSAILGWELCFIGLGAGGAERSFAFTVAFMRADDAVLVLRARGPLSGAGSLAGGPAAPGGLERSSLTAAMRADWEKLPLFVVLLMVASSDAEADAP